MPSSNRLTFASASLEDIEYQRKSLQEELKSIQAELKNVMDRRNALGSKQVLSDKEERARREYSAQVKYFREYISLIEEQLSLLGGAITVSKNMGEIAEHAERANENLRDSTSKPNLEESVTYLQQQVKATE